MDIQKERETFEAWFSYNSIRDHMYVRGERMDEKGNYYSEYAYLAWSAWQAAKAQAVPEQVLDAPACVGGGTFQKGVKWSTVIGAAQRHYENDGHHEAPAICIRDQLRVASGHSVVVPKEPTEEMILNALLVISTEIGKYDIQKEVRMIWEKMIEAQEQKA